jgi:hypothetical protein
MSENKSWIDRNGASLIAVVMGGGFLLMLCLNAKC